MIWLDMNQNGTIEDPAELVYSVNQSVTTLKTFTGNITIPTSGFNGQIPMRVIMRYNATTTLCGTYDFG